jgi:hypothetical protein
MRALRYGEGGEGRGEGREGERRMVQQRSFFFPSNLR